MSPSAPLGGNGLEMPPDFPAAAYEAVAQRVTGHAPASNDLRLEFAAGWNAVSQRFMAMTEYEQSLSTSLGKSSTPYDRYREDRDLYGFFCNGYSVLEATFYAIFSIGSLISPACFPMASDTDKRRIALDATKKAAGKAFPGDPLQNALGTVALDAGYGDWRDIRNVLSHRASPGRSISFSNVPEVNPPDTWLLKSLPLDPATVAAKRAELAGLLTPLMEEIARFAAARL